MTSGENVVQIGSEQYGKAATALNILRESVMGPELFDHAFKEYAQRWAFKHPKPADFFRTMEDASAFDLDWFWRGWFYTTDHVDQSIDNVRWYKLRESDQNLENKTKNVKAGDLAKSGDSNTTNSGNFNNGPEPFSLIETDARLYGEFTNRIDDKAIIEKMKGKNFYEVTLSNKGGLVMPVVLEWTFKDGSTEIERLPAEIWRINEQKITKVFVKEKEVSSVAVDPMGEMADIKVDDNVFPRSNKPSKFDQMRNKGN